MAGQVFFYFLGVITIAGAVGVVALPSPLHGVLSLILCFLGLAGLYLTLGAEFIAAVQVVIYAGAIMVLFLFVIMLLNLGREERQVLQLPVQKLAGVVAALAIFVLLLNVVAARNAVTGAAGAYPAEKIAEIGNTQLLGKLLFSQYMLPFQAMGVLLFVGVIGAVVLARRRTR
ncbi:MAG: NADH-quinone oxidoreductase subunit J [bacterium]|nr:NADH-quinone oxidoreductase subunit J [bacterium]